MGNLVLENGDVVKEMSMEMLFGIYGWEVEERMGEGSGEERRFSCYDVSEIWFLEVEFGDFGELRWRCWRGWSKVVGVWCKFIVVE